MSFDPNAAALEGSGIYGLPSALEDSKVVLIPVPFEATTSYGGGTANGPSAIFEASKQVDLYDHSTGRPYEAGIFMLDESKEIVELNSRAKELASPIIERGGLIDDEPELVKALGVVNSCGKRLNEIVYQKTKELIAQEKIVGIIGGDHSTPFGAIQAHAERYPGLGILHLDAHCDLRKAYEGFVWSHASIMYNVMTHIPNVAKLVQFAIRDFSESEIDFAREMGKDRIAIHFDEELSAKKFEGQTWQKITEDIVEGLPANVYLSFDIDGLDPTLCPNTGTPVPGGCSFQEVVYILKTVVKSGRKIVGFDLNEVAPSPNGDEWDANVGARLLYKMIGYTLL
ncbi:MAG: agmatinase family protein [Blastocatellia bacterium]|nr:agmatinase family protein [Blastocatellia bacterium]